MRRFGHFSEVKGETSIEKHQMIKRLYTITTEDRLNILVNTLNEVGVSDVALLPDFVGHTEDGRDLLYYDIDHTNYGIVLKTENQNGKTLYSAYGIETIH